MGRYTEADWPLTLAGPIDYSKPFSITVELTEGIPFNGVCGDAAGLLLLTYNLMQRSGLGPMRILGGGSDGFASVEAYCPTIDLSAEGKFQWDMLLTDDCITEDIVRRYDVMIFRGWQITPCVLDWAAYHNTLIITNVSMIYHHGRWLRWSTFSSFGRRGMGYLPMTCEVSEDIAGNLTVSYLPGSDDRSQYCSLFLRPGHGLLDVPFFAHESLHGKIITQARGEFF